MPRTKVLKAMKEPVGVIMRRPLPSDTGDYLLFISRPSSVFAQAGTAIFAIDAITSNDHAICATTEHGDIAFSKDIPFLMIPRTLCRPVTMKDLAKIGAEERAEWAKANEGTPTDAPALVEEIPLSTGTYL